MAAWLSSALCPCVLSRHSPHNTSISSLILGPQSPNTQLFIPLYKSLHTIKIPNISTRTELCAPVPCWAVQRSWSMPWSMQCGLESCSVIRVECCRHQPAAGAGASKYTAAAPPTSSHLNKGYILHTALSHHTTSPSPAIHSISTHNQQKQHTEIQPDTLHYIFAQRIMGFLPPNICKQCRHAEGANNIILMI